MSCLFMGINLRYGVGHSVGDNSLTVIFGIC